ncbi:MAG: alkaline phosphatase family protein [Candidatus Bathyarchaeota archaeon]|nr:alkaline phosphatase family protein [Candidatus Bathyarchaeota archaeon]
MNKTLIVFIDGLGYDRVNDSSFTLNLSNEPIRLTPALGYSSAQQSIMWTGKMPSETGRWSELAYFPESSPWWWLGSRYLRYLDELVARAPRKFRSLYEIVARETIRFLSGWIRPFRSYDAFAVPVSKLSYFAPYESDIHQPGCLGETETLFDILRSRGVNYHYIGYPDVKEDHEVHGKGMEAIVENDVIILGFTELDSIEHHHGVDSREARDKLGELNAFINDLIERFESSNPGGTVIVFSDHGMSEVKHSIDVQGRVKDLDLGDGRDYLSFYDATMARFWFYTEAAESMITELLRTIKGGMILEDEELRALGLDFSDDAFGDLIFLVDEGIVVSPNYFQGRTVPRGMHGYHPRNPGQHAFLVKNGEPLPRSTISMDEVFDIFIQALGIT